MNKETLSKMVEIEGTAIKYYKLGEEVTELREELHKKEVTHNTLLEIAQVRFLIRQLESFTDDSHIHYLYDMLEKYSIEGKYKKILQLNDVEINEIAQNEYEKHCRRLNIV